LKKSLMAAANNLLVSYQSLSLKHDFELLACVSHVLVFLGAPVLETTNSDVHEEQRNHKW
jgi:hypothetical protein